MMLRERMKRPLDRLRAWHVFFVCVKTENVCNYENLTECKECVIDEKTR